jgi:hypothetical protein
VGPGAEVLADGVQVGHVTSAAATGGGTACLVRIRWAARDALLTTAEGSPLATQSPPA